MSARRCRLRVGPRRGVVARGPMSDEARKRSVCIVTPVHPSGDVRMFHRMAVGLAERGWEVHVIRHGRLAAAGVIPPGADPTGPLAAILAGAEVVAPPLRPTGAALPEETQILARWLFSPGVRLVSLDGPPWTLPVRGAARHRQEIDVDLRTPALDLVH